MGAERARLLNEEQRRPFVLTQIGSDQSDSDHFMRMTPPTKRQKPFALSARVPSFERDRPPGGPPLVTPQLNGGPARRAVNYGGGGGGGGGLFWSSAFRSGPALRVGGEGGGGVAAAAAVVVMDQPCAWRRRRRRSWRRRLVSENVFRLGPALRVGGEGGGGGFQIRKVNRRFRRHRHIDTQRMWAIGNSPPLCALMPLPAPRSHTPGHRPRTPG